MMCTCNICDVHFEYRHNEMLVLLLWGLFTLANIKDHIDSYPCMSTRSPSPVIHGDQIFVGCHSPFTICWYNCYLLMLALVSFIMVH